MEVENCNYRGKSLNLDFSLRIRLYRELPRKSNILSFVDKRNANDKLLRGTESKSMFIYPSYRLNGLELYQESSGHFNSGILFCFSKY